MSGRRTREAHLADPVFAHFDPEVVETLRTEQLAYCRRFFHHIAARRSAEPVAQDFLDLFAETKSARGLTDLRNALRALMPGHPVLHAVEDAIRAKNRIRRQQRNRESGREPAQRERTLKYSILEQDLPAEIRSVLRDMAAGFEGNGVQAPAASILKRMKMKLRQLCKSALDANLPAELSIPAARVYYADLNNRGLRWTTVRASFEELHRFARYAGYPVEIIQAFATTYKMAASRERLTEPLRYAKLHESGYDTIEAILTGFELLDSAASTSNPRQLRSRLNDAAALALFAVYPLRLNDCRLAFGDELFWDAHGYSLSLTLGKNGYEYEGRLDERLNPFIDALILGGSSPDFLTRMRERCLENKRSLFVTVDGTEVGYNYVSDTWRRHVGTGEHIARSMMHDHLGLKGERGVAEAMIMNGQRDRRVAEKYTTQEGRRASRRAATEEMKAIFAEME